MNAAEREVERLRRALHRMLDASPQSYDWYQNAARRALRGPNQADPEPVSLGLRSGVLGRRGDVDLGAGRVEVLDEHLELTHKHIISNVSSPSVSCKCGEPGCGGNCEECVFCGEMLPEHYFEDGLSCNKCREQDEASNQEREP